MIDKDHEHESILNKYEETLELKENLVDHLESVIKKNQESNSMKNDSFDTEMD